MRLALLVLTLATGAGACPAAAQDQAAVPSEETEVEGVVVTATRRVATLARPGPASPDPFTVFRDYCFEPNRLHGRSARPVGDHSWKPLDAADRQALKIGDPGTLAYGRSGAGPPLVLRIEERAVRKTRVQHRCSLIIVGVADQRSFVRGMSGLFNGPGTEKHVDHVLLDYKTIPGWRQWLWQALPSKGSTRWAVYRNRRSPNPLGHLLFLTGPFENYGGMSYVTGEVVHTEHAARPISILSVARTFRP